MTDSVEVNRLKAELAEGRNLYNDLLYQVASKFPNETRHETAKRYIAQQETKVSNGTAIAKGKENG